MRLVVQRVSRASVLVNGNVVGSIGSGFLVLLGIGKQDTSADAEYLVEKVLGLRVFPDNAGKMNLDLKEIGGSLLLVSQFTLYGDVKKGRRPSFDRAADPELARRLYQYFADFARSRGVRVETGTFQAMMEVELVNDGPVTILCDSEKVI
jgi:D-tyrosyl-tRNA(Tyr) deacylase